MPAFLGMRGTGDWVTDQRPKNWRETVLYLYPNGSAPLTAILSKMGEQNVDDPEFNWWTKTLPEQAGAVTGVFTDVALANAYAGGGVQGATLFVRCAEAVANEFRVGHVAMLRMTTDYRVDVVGKVTAVTKNGAQSVIAVRLIEDDDNSPANDLTGCDRVLVVGNMNAEGAGMPDALSYDPVKLYNYTQIFRTPLEITRTAQKTRLRTGDQYKESKREALELHSIEMEKGFLWGVRYEGIGSNGKPERMTSGLLQAIRLNAVANVDDYSLNPNYNGVTWLNGGEEWLDDRLEQIFRYGDRDKLAFCGSGTLLGINRLIKNSGNFEFNPTTESYGIKVVKWVTAFGTINMMTHPLFSYEVTNRHSMVIFEPRNLKYRFITDTTFYDDDEKKNTGHNRYDGLKEEYLTEAGLEYHHPIGWGYLNGVGIDNP